MGHIRHENRAACVGDFAHLIVVDVARVCRRAGNEDLGPEEEGVLHELVVVDDTGRLVQPVRHLLEVKRRCRDLLAGNFKTLGVPSNDKRVIQASDTSNKSLHATSALQTVRNLIISETFLGRLQMHSMAPNYSSMLGMEERKR